MGNCLHPAELSPSTQNSSQLNSEDLWNFSYDGNDSFPDVDYDANLEAAAPCHSCNLLDDSALPFFILVSVLGILASGTVLFMFFRPLFHWQLCPGWPVLAQLAVGSALFSIVVPILAPGLGNTRSSALCSLGYCVWYGSAFAQALLLGCHASLGPKLGAGQVPGLTLGLSVGLWGVAALLTLPITLASGASGGLCTPVYSMELKALQATHAVACLAVFVLLPLGLFGAKGLKKALGMGPGPWMNILWAWFIFWWPHGVVLGLDFLVRSKLLLLSTCLAQQALDLLLNLAEALAILHCVATPLLLALFCHQATRTLLPSLPLPEGWSSHLDTLGSKS
uniref:Atypical chemokine receptor 1 n=3 Tax=Cercopithecinae TaxID=9528 RepID=F2X0I9_MANLE|nr:Duffy antigen/chemokine receptor [Mandrillus sphinx]ADZ55412.1 Duffy antigen/chemokine receptor [Mandrillus leucophaeus]AQV03458.1 duffy antigen/chemokine receptor [Macaca nemestrina]